MKMFEIILQKQISCVYIYSVLLFYSETVRSGWSKKSILISVGLVLKIHFSYGYCYFGS